MPYVSPCTVTLPAQCIKVSELAFHLSTASFSYIFHVDDRGDLVLDHYGAPTPAARPEPTEPSIGWQRVQSRREFPGAGRGDMRLPAIHIAHPNSGGHTVSKFVYKSYEVVPGKPTLPGLPATFGSVDDVSTLLITLVDAHSDLEAVLAHSVFGCGALTRSWSLKNRGQHAVVIERAASISVDFPSGDLELVHHHGNWGRERMVVRRKVEHGTQGFQSLAGYASHMYNPFFALARPDTTERLGEAWGFNLVYSGSFSASIEQCLRGYTRAMLGLNPLHLSWTLTPGETFTTPECVTVSSAAGMGGMSRVFHLLYRHHLCKSAYVLQHRPVLNNNWEATYFDMDEDRLYPIAKTASLLSCKLFVMDDGWFGDKHPRINDHAGLGDWVVNHRRFKNGLAPFVNRINALTSSRGPMLFGIWIEPEMVNPVSELY